MWSVLERDVAMLRGRAGRALLVEEGSRAACVVLVGLGCVALVLRAVAGTPRAALALIGLCALIVALLVAWRRARRRTPGIGAAVAWLDQRAGADGLLLTQAELDDPRWRARADARIAAAPPMPRVIVGPALRRTLPAVLFAAVPFLLPQMSSHAHTPGLDPSAAIAQLREKLATLDELLLEERREDLTARLDRLEQEARAARPEAAWEGIDRMEQALRHAAREAEQDLAAAAQRASELAAQAQDGDADAAAADLNELQDSLARLGFEPQDVATAADLPLPERAQELIDHLRETAQGLADAGLLKELDPRLLGAIREVRAVTEARALRELELRECTEACAKSGFT